MILLDVGGLGGVVVMIYLILHAPAFIMLISAAACAKSKPKAAKTLLILAGIYFLVGGGICGAMFT